jgi:hypothetical protein
MLYDPAEMLPETIGLADRATMDCLVLWADRLRIGRWREAFIRKEAISDTALLSCHALVFDGDSAWSHDMCWKWGDRDFAKKRWFK